MQMETASALFKYCHPERVGDIVEKRKIRFSPVGALNDPFECLPNQDFLNHPNWRKKIEREMIQQKLPVITLQWTLSGRKFSRADVVSFITNKVRVTLDTLGCAPSIKQEALQTQRTQREALRILCFSKTPPDDPEHSLLVWAHYTDGHKGFVVGFDPKHPWVSDFSIGKHGRAGLVKYTDRRPSVQIDEHGDVVPGKHLVFWKATKWNYEREYRIVSDRGYKKFTHEPFSALADFPAEMIQTITLGSECDPNTAAKIIKETKRPEMKHVRLRQARIDHDRYALVLHDL